MSAATIGSALADKRRELGLEKGRAATKIGMSRTTYSSYEQDTQRPSADVFPAIARFLDISIEELLALYGATCVAALRLSLESLTSDLPDGTKDSEISEEPRAQTEAPERNESEANGEGLVTAPEEFETMATAVTSKSSDGVDPIEASDQREDQVVESEPESEMEDLQDNGVVVTELSHLIEVTPPTESRQKSSGNKKKKKKKKKRN